MTTADKQCIFLNMVSMLVRYADGQEIPVKVCEWYRTPQRQQEMVATGKSMTSSGKHVLGLAVDLAVIREGAYITIPDDYKTLGAYWKIIGGRWGGDFSFGDYNHFEYMDRK